MVEPLYELLFRDCEESDTLFPDKNHITTEYLTRLSTISVQKLRGTEPENLQQDAHTLRLSIQALSRRSYQSIDTIVHDRKYLQKHVSQASTDSSRAYLALPRLEKTASSFASKYNKLTNNTTLDRRKKALRLGENIDRLSDVLELPSLLTSTITSSATAVAGSANASLSSANSNYTSALDLHSHVRRLHKLYPDSALVKSVAVESEEAMRQMTTNLIVGLRSQSLKLAGGMRLIGLLKRVAPELDDSNSLPQAFDSVSEGSLGALFLVCRLSNLHTTLEALEPLRELANQETPLATQDMKREADKKSWTAGQQTERYLKRYVEIFREQCFAVISMYKSIFPASLPGPTSNTSQEDIGVRIRTPNVKAPDRVFDTTDMVSEDEMQRLPSALSTFTFHIVGMLMETLETYLPNVRDQGSRDSLATQILYCSASLGRLGGDFGMMLSTLKELEHDIGSGFQAERSLSDSAPEWVHMMQKHRTQASRLELLATGANANSSRSSYRELTT